MAVEIKKTYKEHLPSLRLIGKRYLNSDRLHGGFGHKWGEWWQNAWFDEIEKLNPIPENDDANVGAMRIVNDVFEYWIGMFFPENTPVPDGFDYVDIKAFDIITCWIYGNEQNGEIYGMDVHNMVASEVEKLGLVHTDDDWCFERYQCPRFTTPDEKGNVILDYCISVK